MGQLGGRQRLLLVPRRVGGGVGWGVAWGWGEEQSQKGVDSRFLPCSPAALLSQSSRLPFARLLPLFP